MRILLCLLCLTFTACAVDGATDPTDPTHPTVTSADTIGAFSDTGAPRVEPPPACDGSQVCDMDQWDCTVCGLDGEDGLCWCHVDPSVVCSIPC
jgi:hypothetical protein